MPSLLRSLQAVAIAFWVGGIAFFAFVLAPTAFLNLPSAQEAGLVVRASILALHRIALICGIVFLAAFFLLRSRKRRQAILVGLMLLITLFSQQRILPKMDEDRFAAKVPIEALSLDDARRVDFDRLHALSEQLEGMVLVLGVTVIALVACETGAMEP